MSIESGVVCIPLSTSRLAYQPSRPRIRNLGAAILLAAVQDYRRLDEEMHQGAAQFLYPQTQESQDHYEWVVSLADGVNPAWLRDSLDRSRKKWDWQRAERISASGRVRRIVKRRKGNEARKCS